jgi:hypothetical protein
MDIDDRFAVRIEHIEEAPSPLREAMLAALAPSERSCLFAFAPGSTITDMRWPATLLAITDRRWILVSADEGQEARTTACDFTDTLLVELTTILLKGHLKIDFASDGGLKARGIEFNAVMTELYLEAAHRLLNGIDERSGDAVADAAAETRSLLDGWPLKFLNAVRNHLPPGQPLMAACHWPAIYGVRRELAPARALAVSERVLLLVSDEPAGPWWPSEAKLGTVVTYFPRRRLAGFHFIRYPQFAILDQ